MPPSIPPGFVNVSTARSRQGFVNVIGVVVDCLAQARTNGSSYVVTFTIKDFELEKEPWNGLKIKYFNDNEHLLPDLIRHDVVLLRQIRVSSGANIPLIFLMLTCQRYDLIKGP